jgi:hypothetical protein
LENYIYFLRKKASNTFEDKITFFAFKEYRDFGCLTKCERKYDVNIKNLIVNDFETLLLSGTKILIHLF